MKDPHEILGVPRTASDAEIKKAYKRLAMKYHPDRNGGDEQKFKEITAAYEQIQQGVEPVPRFNFDFKDFFRQDSQESKDRMFEDLLREARRKYQPQVSLSASISFKDAVLGGEQYMKIPIHGRVEYVKITIPPGIVNDSSIKYPNLSKGVDVLINFKVEPDPTWKTEGLNLIKECDINIWDLILGSSLEVETIDGNKIRLKIPARTQPNTFFRIKQKGMVDRHTHKQGDMLVKLNAKIPDFISEDLLIQIQKVRG